MRQRTTLPWIFVILAMMVATLACNLTGQAPPTIPPRPSATPPPTIGYTPLAPNQLPEQATAAPQSQGNMISLLAEVNTDRLMGHVEMLQSFGTRHVASPYDNPRFGIGAALNYIQGQFQEIQQQSGGNLAVTVQPFDFTYNNQPYPGYNVIGIINGTETGAGVIVVGAHYDSISFDFQNSLANAPGANDDASGIAALIEMARVMAMRPHRQTLIFVAFGAEEIGRLGSQAFVEGYVQAYNLPLMAMINMDIIGSSTGADGQYNDRQVRMFSAGPNESLSRQLARGLDLVDNIYVSEMDVIVQDGEDRPGRYGDHMSFSEVGYPAVRFVEATENRERQHNDSDVSSALQPLYLTHSTQTILAGLTSLADGPRPPLNVSLRINGDGTQTLFWEPVVSASNYLVVLRRPGSLVYDDWFQTQETSTSWDGFVSTRYEALAIASYDANGLIGPLSAEYRIP
ncbi:MAG: M20/M25/M40 family metallo-hydrolase [Anaerolineae bacterium]